MNIVLIVSNASSLNINAALDYLSQTKLSYYDKFVNYYRLPWDKNLNSGTLNYLKLELHDNKPVVKDFLITLPQHEVCLFEQQLKQLDPLINISVINLKTNLSNIERNYGEVILSYGYAISFNKYNVSVNMFEAITANFLHPYANLPAIDPAAVDEFLKIGIKI